MDGDFDFGAVFGLLGDVLVDLERGCGLGVLLAVDVT